MEATKLLPYYTYDDYCNWEGRWEIIDGIPYAMSPAPSPQHQWLVINIASELRTALKSSNCTHCRVYDFIDVKVKEDTVVQPDVSIVCGQIEKKYLDFPPALVVEVLSKTTYLKDRISKFSIYRNFGIKYYLIIDPDEEKVEINQLVDSEYVLQDANDDIFSFKISDDCEIELGLRNIWE